jgi:hypothetical protein
MLVVPIPVLIAERNTLPPLECLKETSQLPETVSCRTDGVTIVYAINADPLELTLYSTLGCSSLEQERSVKDAKSIVRIVFINFIRKMLVYKQANLIEYFLKCSV